MCLMTYANNNGADQPAHARSLISTFVVHCLGSMIYIYLLYPMFQDSSFSVAEQAGLNRTWLKTLKTHFA